MSQNIQHLWHVAVITASPFHLVRQLNMTRVTLIGAGPGRPDLISMRGLDALRRADILLYDRLISDDLLAEVRADATKIFVGKRTGHHPTPQPQINALLIEHARTGKQVVRLKGGDPFVLGRGGEEALALAEVGIPFEVVPGITSALAVPAYAGVPLTEKKLGAAFSIVTGHEDPTKPESQLDWTRLVHMPTLVILMAVKRIRTITDDLLASGCATDRPALAVSRGTTGEQRIVSATVATLAAEIEQQQLPTPAIIVVGDVAGLADPLGWFDPREVGANFIADPKIAPAALMNGSAMASNGSVASVPDPGRGDDGTGRNGAPVLPNAASAFNEPVPTGRVYIAGAGPGHPDLITVRAAKALAQANVILHDRLVSPQLLARVKPSARMINVGKSSKRDRFSQATITQMLVDEALANPEQIVLRLKGGDPFIFGLGSDECAALAAANVPFEVVPGISSVTAVPAFAGIPVTHRGLSTMMTVVSGHGADEAQIGGIAWGNLSSRGTLVVLMGLRKLRLIAQQLLQAGWAGETPIAVIESGTTDAQHVSIGTLANLPAALDEMDPPVLVVIGNVVNLHEQLAWFGEGIAKTANVWGVAVR